MSFQVLSNTLSNNPEDPAREALLSSPLQLEKLR
jgi:hypothetical protein